MRAFIEYFDISMTIVNSTILVFAASIFQVNTLFIIINLISIGVLCGIAIYTFSQNNPYYVVSCYVLAVFGFIITIGLLTTPKLSIYPTILLIFILYFNIHLGASLVKSSASSRARFVRMAGVQVIIEPGINPTAIEDRKPGTHKDDLKKIENSRKLMQEKYKAKLIILITVISSISYLSTKILSFI